MALSLLIEVAYEHDEEFRQHLPQVSPAGCPRDPLCHGYTAPLRLQLLHAVLKTEQMGEHGRQQRGPVLTVWTLLDTLSPVTALGPQLLHVCLLNADSPNPSVRRDSQQLLIYLLYSLSLKHLEAAQVGAITGSQGQSAVGGPLVGQQLPTGAVLWSSTASTDKPLLHVKRSRPQWLPPAALPHAERRHPLPRMPRRGRGCGSAAGAAGAAAVAAGAALAGAPDGAQCSCSGPVCASRCEGGRTLSRGLWVWRAAGCRPSHSKRCLSCWLTAPAGFATVLLSCVPALPLLPASLPSIKYQSAIQTIKPS